MPAAATDTGVRISRVLNAPPERVFRAWTTPEEMKNWASPPGYTNPFVGADLRVGGRYEIHMLAPSGLLRRVAGTYREIDPPRKLVYTWLWEEPAGAPESVVTVEFRPHAQGTELILLHDCLPTAESREQHAQGWTGCLVKLLDLYR